MGVCKYLGPGVEWLCDGCLCVQGIGFKGLGDACLHYTLVEGIKMGVCVWTIGAESLGMTFSECLARGQRV